MDIDIITISNKFACEEKGFRYFRGCKNEELITHLCIRLRKMTGYVKFF